MTLSELVVARNEAGEKYQQIVDAFYEAYVRLAPLDAVLANSNINPQYSEIRTFSPLSADLRPFDHPIYCPLKLPCDWRQDVAVRRDELIDEFEMKKRYLGIPERSYL